MRSFKTDLEFGLNKEEEMINKIKQQFPFEKDIKNTKDLYNNIYCSYDYEGMTHNSRFELKSRTCKKDAYKTTIIPVHKINDISTGNGEKDLYCIFNFTDFVTYIKYDKKLFDKFEKKTYKIQREGRYDPATLHYEIPTALLLNFNSI